MSRKKRLRKRKMKEDQLVTYALRSSQWLQEHFTQVLVGVAVLLAGVGIAFFTANARRNTAAQAREELAKGLSQYQNGMIPDASTTFLNLADRYSGHDAGVTAMYFLGETYLAQARYAEALTAYERYLESSDAKAFFHVAAMIGKSMAFEGEQKYQEAGQTLEQVLQSLPEDDPRRMDLTFRAASFYQQAKSLEDAKRLFGVVAAADDSRLSPRADLWLAILE